MISWYHLIIPVNISKSSQAVPFQLIYFLCVHEPKFQNQDHQLSQDTQ